MSEKRSDEMMLSIFLKHKEKIELRDIDKNMEKNNFWSKFPPEGIEIVSWYVMMGVGQVVTLRFPPERLREINLVLEMNASCTLSPEYFPTYDYKEIYDKKHAKAVSKQNNPTSK